MEEPDQKWYSWIVKLSKDGIFLGGEPSPKESKRISGKRSVLSQPKD